MRKKPIASAVALLAAVAVMLALLVREDDAPAQVATDLPAALPFPLPPPVEPPPPVDDDVASAPAEEEGRPAFCDGCLHERAVLDVAETFLRHLNPDLLHWGIRAQPLAEVAPETPGRVFGLPKLPPGLLDAPEHNPMGVTVDTRLYDVETAWLVWVQIGWRSHEIIEKLVEYGDLPEVALSWPPIKNETYVVVDSRSGDLKPVGLFAWSDAGPLPPYPPHHLEMVAAATRERADRWLREEAASG